MLRDSREANDMELKKKAIIKNSCFVILAHLKVEMRIRLSLERIHVRRYLWPTHYDAALYLLEVIC